MKKAAVLLLLFAVWAQAAERRAKNVILFIGDAGGVPALHAASVYAHDHPQKLFIQSMSHIALMDTSAANGWVTDSAAGMTAIVTGQKTKNGVISQSADAVRGKTDGTPLKTILEHAEERGLSTGVITNVSAADATPAACYAHANDRKLWGEIFSQIVKPRYGDGVDIVIGAGRDQILAATEKLGLDVLSALRGKGYSVYDSPTQIKPEDTRVVALVNAGESGDFDPGPTVDRAIEILSRNPNGFFLMVEWDMHTNNLKRGLDRVIAIDEVIRKTAENMKDDTLIVYAADHSFDIRVVGGRKGEAMLPEKEADGAASPRPRIRVDNSHTGEQVLAAAEGPGAEQVRGFIDNTDLFKIMMSAYGWSATEAGAVAAGR